jgi:acetyltransferase-like isoleucine patch superfamily enzyme
MILKGVNIGPRAIIGAGAIVTKDVNPGDVVAGNPARVIGSETQDQEESSYYENAGNRF